MSSSKFLIHAANHTASRLRWLAVLLLSLLFGFALANIALLFSTCGPLLYSSPAMLLQKFFILAWIAFGVLGLLIVFYRPQNRIGWLCLVISLTGSAHFAADAYTVCGLAGGMALPGVTALAWFLYAVAPTVLITCIFILLPMLFPDGRFLSPRWRFAVQIILLPLFIANAIMALAPDFRQANGVGFIFPLDNPLGLVPALWVSVAARASNLLLIAGGLLAIASMMARFRHAQGDERQQLKWIAYFLATAVAIQLVVFELIGFRLVESNPEFMQTAGYELFMIVYNIVLNIVFIGLPVVIGLTVFKYHLYDIDIIIRRTLQYSIVSTVLTLVYFGAVTVIQGGITAVTHTQSPLAIVISTLLIAALFTPLRRSVQQFVDRRFFRKKYNAQQVLAQFAQTARDEVSLEALETELLRVVQETLQPAHQSIWVQEAKNKNNFGRGKAT